ncbi:MAG TPA: hypothetical protein VH164_01775 [Ktedonobacteraceae bacterium]|jgi:hypothetical protein|nr:hypothetical protein [Ktedonobacteraceae bacterium]
MEVAEKPIGSQEEIASHLAELNWGWQRYGDVIDNQVKFASPRARAGACKLALEMYYRNDMWLAQQGYPFHVLDYDQTTRTFSLPGQKHG